MKILGVISLIIAYVAARGSGPYLPSGWKPDGPAFFLPSEASKPLKESIIDAAFSDSEASGSDFLREYGPPKLQAVSQNILQQGLPDVANEQLFIETVSEINSARENSNVVIEATEEKLEVNVEVTAAEEPLATTEPQLVAATKSVANVEEEAVFQLNIETTASAIAAESVEGVDEIGYLVEPTVAIVALTEKVSSDLNEPSENQILGDTVVESQQLTYEQQDSDQSVRQVEESAILSNVQLTTEAGQLTGDVSEQVQSTSEESSKISVTQQSNINLDLISAVEEKIETVEEEVKKAEQVVQIIPELIVGLENEVKSQQAETIQEVPAIVQELFGSLDQAPEGFLEYGPPGFREYGPPKENLSDNIIEEKVLENNLIQNSEIRRRRFSPKFRTFVKTH